MKRSRILIAAALMGILLCVPACSKGSVGTHNNTGSSGIAQVLQSEIEKEDAKNEANNDAELDDNSGADVSQDASQNVAQNTTQNGATDQNNLYIGNVDSVAEEDYIDLTGMSADMIYAVVYDMMSRPDTYIGKTIKIEGLFSYYYDEASDIAYYACIIEDARACCAQGMEFVPQDQYSYPDDYPEMFDSITVTGTFDIYYEGEQQDIAYMTLRNAVLG